VTDPQPTYTHDCEECVFLGTVTNSQMILVTDEVASALTAHMNDFVSIADINKALGQKPPDVWDLYFCQKGTPSGAWPTVLARHGDDGGNYKSGAAAAQFDDELALALKLARVMGLVP